MDWLTRLIEMFLGPTKSHRGRDAAASDGLSEASSEPSPAEAGPPSSAAGYDRLYTPPSTAPTERAPDAAPQNQPQVPPAAAPGEAAAPTPDDTGSATIKIVVTQFKNDREDGFTNGVIDTLKTASILDVSMKTAPFEDAGEFPAVAKLAAFQSEAREWLTGLGADIVLHGVVTRTGIRIRLVASLPSAECRPDTVGLGDTILVSHNFGAEMANLIYATVLAVALPVKPDLRQTMAPHLAGAGDRCLKLLEALPKGTQAAHLGAIYTCVGVTSANLWRLQSSSTYLSAAVAAFEKANREGPKEITPLVMAELKLRHGLALQELSAANGDEDMFEDALDAFETVTGGLDPKTHPREWGLAYLALGGAYLGRGRKELTAEDCNRAVTAFDAAMRVFSAEKDLRRWRECMSYKGNALLTLGTINLGVEELVEASEIFREVMGACDRERQPVPWAQASTALGSALFAYAKRNRDRDSLNEAIQCFDGALAVYERRNQAVAIGVVRKNQQRAYRLRESLEG